MKKLLSFVIVCASLSVSAQTYREEEITFRNGDIVLSGTLSFPASEKEKHKAVILVSGSGPQNRDSEVFGFKPFKLLAEFFNEEGYAVLRYDDRGFGKSKGKSVNESTTAELAEDARQAYLYLRTRDDIAIENIGMLGHSEGGVVVPIVASKEPVAFLVLMAGFGVRGRELSNAQQEAILRSNGMSETFIKAAIEMNGAVLDKMTNSNTTEQELQEFVKSETLKLLPLLPETIQAQITDKEMYATMSAQQAVQQSKSVWIRHYMNYDPLPVLKNVKCPVLMLFGELDTQVLPSQNSNLMKEALLESGNGETIILPKANHLFQEAVTGSPAEYGTLKKEFTPLLLPAIRNWLIRI